MSSAYYEVLGYHLSICSRHLLTTNKLQLLPRYGCHRYTSIPESTGMNTCGRQKIKFLRLSQHPQPSDSPVATSPRPMNNVQRTKKNKRLALSNDSPSHYFDKIPGSATCFHQLIKKENNGSPAPPP